MLRGRPTVTPRALAAWIPATAFRQMLTCSAGCLVRLVCVGPNGVKRKIYGRSKNTLRHRLKLWSISIRYALVLLGSYLLVSCGGGGGTSSSPPSVSTPTPAPTSSVGAMTIQEAIDNGVNKGVDGIFIYVDQASESPVTTSAGIQDRRSSEPAVPESLFKIASVSKLFIAVTVTKLIHQNILRQDDTLAMWLPTLVGRISNTNIITLRNMLQHRSGIPDFDSQRGFSWQLPQTDIDQTLEYALDLPADFVPDARYEYSNTNYLLLAKVIDSALGYSHRTHIQDFILMPLGMTDTYSLLAEIDSDLMVRGYWEDKDRTEQDYVIPGGSMISTVKDTAVFLRSLATGSLMSVEERRLYTSLYFLRHSGWLPGYQSIARYEPDIDTVIVLFVNNTGDDSEIVIESTYNTVLSILRNQ